MSMPRWVRSSAATLPLLAASLTAAPHVARACTAPQEMTRFSVKLPNTARALLSGKPLVIVAIGSSSTQGVGASDPAHTYPARLAEELRRNWPKAAVAVINKGVRGEIAAQMLARFDRDVLHYQPHLVIWQTGSNHALRSDNIGEYNDTVREGISRLKAATADVVLMDPQFAPRVLARPIHLTVVNSMDAIARDTNVALFRRFAVMQHWISSGQYRIEDIISSDGLHMNNVSYNCIARLLAGAVVAAAEHGIESVRRMEALKTRPDDVSRDRVAGER